MTNGKQIQAHKLLTFYRSCRVVYVHLLFYRYMLHHTLYSDPSKEDVLLVEEEVQRLVVILFPVWGSSDCMHQTPCNRGNQNRRIYGYAVMDIFAFL